MHTNLIFRLIVFQQKQRRVLFVSMIIIRHTWAEAKMQKEVWKKVFVPQCISVTIGTSDQTYTEVSEVQRQAERFCLCCI